MTIFWILLFLLGFSFPPNANAAGDTLAEVEYKDKKIGIRFEMESCRPLGVATYRTTGALRNFRLVKLDKDGEPVK